MKIGAREILMDIWRSVDAIGVNEIGFTSADVGTHSVRVSLAMIMYLSREPIYTIMLISRWNSGAFLTYTEK